MMSDSRGRFDQLMHSQPTLLRTAIIGAAVLGILFLLIFYFFPGSPDKAPGQKSPRNVTVPRIRPSKRDYKFQEHLEGPYPFEYKPPVQPGKLAEMLRELSSGRSATHHCREQNTRRKCPHPERSEVARQETVVSKVAEGLPRKPAESAGN